MMFYGGIDPGGLEVRRASDGSVRLRGRFPYGRTAVLSDGGRTGRPRKEQIRKRAFRYRVEDPKADIHLLVGHDFGKPLASKLTRTLSLSDSDEALSFEAVISPEVQQTSWWKDAAALLGAGLAVGLSPGFRLPPERVVPKAETVETEPMRPEEGEHGAIIRTILEALLFELSIVTAPAYDEAQVELRNWDAGRAVQMPFPRLALLRWRP